MVLGPRLKAVALLAVDSVGLLTLAATCEDLAVDIIRPPIAACPTSSYQATSAAVSVVHNGVATTSLLLARRMQFTSALLRDASKHYSATEMNSTDEIRHVAGSA